MFYSSESTLCHIRSAPATILDWFGFVMHISLLPMPTRFGRLCYWSCLCVSVFVCLSAWFPQK